MLVSNVKGKNTGGKMQQKYFSHKVHNINVDEDDDAIKNS